MGWYRNKHTYTHEIVEDADMYHHHHQKQQLQHILLQKYQYCTYFFIVISLRMSLRATWSVRLASHLVISS